MGGSWCYLSCWCYRLLACQLKCLWLNLILKCSYCPNSHPPPEANNAMLQCISSPKCSRESEKLKIYCFLHICTQPIFRENNLICMSGSGSVWMCMLAIELNYLKCEIRWGYWTGYWCVVLCHIFSLLGHYGVLIN